MSNAGSSDVTGNDDSNIGTESEKGEDSNSVDAFVQSHKNGDSEQPQQQLNGVAKAAGPEAPSSIDEDANEDYPPTKKLKLDETTTTTTSSPLPVAVAIESA